jgi:hypothetical protein
MHRKDDGVLALAGLYEFWLDKTNQMTIPTGG